jgi:hypothetical protein
MESAKEFCERLDKETGEWWSNDYEELPKQMQLYAEYYHKCMLESLKKDENEKKIKK